MVELFSDITTTEIKDLTFFEELLDKHFHKFRYFFNIFSCVSDEKINYVKSISCVSYNSNNITIEMKFSSVKKLKEYLKEFKENILYNDIFEVGKYFTLSFSTDSKKLNILINEKNISGEGDIYEDRFNSY